MKLLINLARADGQIGDREKNYLINIGRVNGIYPDEIYPLLTQRHDTVIPADLSEDEKFELLFHLVQLMKLDERMYREEITFCGQIAARLGYEKTVMFELLSRIKSQGVPAEEKQALRDLTRSFLRKS